MAIDAFAALQALAATLDLAYERPGERRGEFVTVRVGRSPLVADADEAERMLKRVETQQLQARFGGVRDAAVRDIIGQLVALGRRALGGDATVLTDARIVLETLVRPRRLDAGFSRTFALSVDALIHACAVAAAAPALDEEEEEDVDTDDDDPESRLIQLFSQLRHLREVIVTITPTFDAGAYVAHWPSRADIMTLLYFGDLATAQFPPPLARLLQVGQQVVRETAPLQTDPAAALYEPTDPAPPSPLVQLKRLTLALVGTTAPLLQQRATALAMVDALVRAIYLVARYVVAQTLLRAVPPSADDEEEEEVEEDDDDGDAMPTALVSVSDLGRRREQDRIAIAADITWFLRVVASHGPADNLSALWRREGARRGPAPMPPHVAVVLAMERTEHRYALDCDLWPRLLAEAVTRAQATAADRAAVPALMVEWQRVFLTGTDARWPSLCRTLYAVHEWLRRAIVAELVDAVLHGTFVWADGRVTSTPTTGCPTAAPAWPLADGSLLELPPAVLETSARPASVTVPGWPHLQPPREQASGAMHVRLGPDAAPEWWVGPLPATAEGRRVAQSVFVPSVGALWLGRGEPLATYLLMPADDAVKFANPPPETTLADVRSGAIAGKLLPPAEQSFYFFA